MGPEKIGTCRAVLDCNVIISAVLFKGKMSGFVGLWKSGSFVFLACKEMIQEWTRVLAYPKFQLGEQDVRYLIEKEILPYVEPVSLEEVPAIVKEDPMDDIYVACADQGKADYLVSGDEHLLKLHPFRDITIVTPMHFLNLIQR